MGRHGVAHLMRPLAHRLHHLRRHLQLARHALLFGVQHTAGDHQLHQIHALLPSLLQLGQCLVDGVGRHRHRPGHVAAGNGDALIGRQNAGSHPPSGPNIVPQPGVEVRQTAHRADGGDAGEQLLLGKARHHAVGHLPGQSRGEDGLYQLLVVPLLFLRLAAARQMDVHIDEPRHQIAALQVHHLIARQIRPLRYDVRNAVAVGPQHQSLTGLHLPCAVQQLATTKCVFHRSPRPFLFECFLSAMPLASMDPLRYNISSTAPSVNRFAEKIPVNPAQEARSRCSWPPVSQGAYPAVVSIFSRKIPYPSAGFATST